MLLSLTILISALIITTISAEKTTSPQFAGCITHQTFKSIAHADSYGLLSKQEDNLACMELCGNKKFLYSYYHPRTAECHCTKTSEIISPEMIEDGCDNLGGCNPCQAVITYLQSPLSFTSCHTHLGGKPFLILDNDENMTLDKCLSICSTDIYDTEVVGFQSKLILNPNARSKSGKSKLERKWICNCYSGKNNGAAAGAGSSKKKLSNLHSNSNSKNCGKDGFWRFEVPRQGSN